MQIFKPSNIYIGYILLIYSGQKRVVVGVTEQDERHCIPHCAGTWVPRIPDQAFHRSGRRMYLGTIGRSSLIFTVNLLISIIIF